MKNILTILIVLISINCYSQDHTSFWGRSAFGSVDRSFGIDNFRANENIKSYVLNTYNHSGMKFIFDITVDGYEHDTYIYGRVFKEDLWTLIMRSDSSRITYLDKFLYIREFKLVSKTGAFTRIKTKLFYE